jgi:hypothetical protein
VDSLLMMTRKPLKLATRNAATGKMDGVQSSTSEQLFHLLY